jgi:hypothetical protein
MEAETLEIILKLQKEVCEYKRFCGDLLFDLKEGVANDHIAYDIPWVKRILELLIESKVLVLPCAAHPS